MDDVVRELSQKGKKVDDPRATFKRGNYVDATRAPREIALVRNDYVLFFSHDAGGTKICDEL